MKVTPLEIRQKTFEKAFRGYEKDEVDAYLGALSSEWEKLQEDYREVKNKNEQLERDLVKMREVESSLYKTLKTAETTGSNMVEQANKTAELLLKEAQMNTDALLNDAKYQAKNILEEADMKAKNMVEDAKDHVKLAVREIKQMENIKDNLLMDLKNLANDTLERINKLSTKKTLKEVVSTTAAAQEVADIVQIETISDKNKDQETKPKTVKSASFFDQL